MRHRILTLLLAGGAAILWACADHSPTGARMQKGQGTIAMQLVDDPTTLDSIASVNIFVVRVDAREKIADSTAADSNVTGDGDMDDRDNDHRDSTAWVTIASPNKLIDIKSLTGSDTAFLGAAVVDTAKFRALRIIIDPSKSNVVLKNGAILTDSTTPSVEFFSRGRHGILVDLDNDADVQEGTTTTITLDFRLGESIMLRGRTMDDGLIIRAVVLGHARRDGDDGHH
jgi:hypothetical protein